MRNINKFLKIIESTASGFGEINFGRYGNLSVQFCRRAVMLNVGYQEFAGRNYFILLYQANKIQPAGKIVPNQFDFIPVNVSYLFYL